MSWKFDNRYLLLSHCWQNSGVWTQTGVSSESCTAPFSCTIFLPYPLTLILDKREKDLKNIIFPFCLETDSALKRVILRGLNWRKINCCLYVDYLSFINLFKAFFSIIHTESVSIVSTPHSFDWWKLHEAILQLSIWLCSSSGVKF